MDFSYWFLFISGMGALLLTPGPTTLTVASFTVRHGRSAVVYLVCGVALADLTYMTLGLAIHSALLTVSEALFLGLRIFGLGYALYLAWGLWHAEPPQPKTADSPASHAGAGWPITGQIYLVTITNPKGMLFLFGLLPLYIPSGGITVIHGLAMTIVFVSLSALNITFWGLLSGSALGRFARWRHVGKLSALILLTAVALVWGLDYVSGDEPA